MWSQIDLYDKAYYTVIRFLLNDICTVLGPNGTLVEAKIRTWDICMCVF
jgi:hypothetical protein